MAENTENERSDRSGAWIGAGLAAATIGAAFLWGRKGATGDADVISDAPPHVLRGDAARQVQGDEAVVGRTVTIGRPRQELYDFWRGFERLPQFMDNVRKIERVDDETSRWTIKGPAGTDVEIVSKLVEDVPGSKLAWESAPDSDIDTSGVIEFTDAPADRGTYVRFLMAYDPPGGTVGRGIAKLLQREPTVQARRDLRRFKQLMETGEVTKNASPSARESESPTEARV
ncbi:SRPBCC family protein [Sphingomonas flavescens]|uniref:SRPBCC family protein n=1 Tax=Sphingomonas flavescens TaxID=3132797 RepID=UPI002804F0E8|nr:SRPBCC family protein [Sphingomonas limnosediminicola]